MTSKIPEHYSPAKKRIIFTYIQVTSERKLAGSELYREISKRLFYKIDRNQSNSFVREVVREFITAGC